MDQDAQACFIIFQMVSKVVSVYTINVFEIHSKMQYLSTAILSAYLLPG